ncbi:ankyrin repeat domain-containing protein 31-like isoform X2 [Anarhichas minor]
MTDSCNQEHGRNGDASSSDDDSVSLLCDHINLQSRGVPEDMEIDDLDSQFGNKEQEKEAGTEMNRLNPPESGIPSCAQSAAGRADPTSQSAKVWQCVKLPNKIQVNKRNGKGETLLHKACKRGDLVQVQALIQAGISINAEDNAGWTALHEASAFGTEAVVEELLKAGANVHVRSFDGVTPLHDAVYAGYNQVVKLLLQYGSNPSDRNGADLNALDMAEEEDIKELLSLSVSSVPCQAPARHRPPGDASSEAHWLSRSDTANVASRHSGDGGRAREPGDIQPGRKDSTADDRHSQTLTVVLEEVGRKQTEISAWPLTGPEDAGRYHAALTQIQKVLIEALTKQQLEKDALAQRCRSVPGCLLQRLLKSQLASLASRQRTVVELLQVQIRLAEVYVTAKARLSTQPPNHGGSSVVRWPAASTAGEAHSCDQNGRERHRPVTQTSAVRSTPPSGARGRSVPRPPAPPLTLLLKKDATRTDVPKQKASGCQSSATQAGNTSRRVSFQMKGNNALIQTQAEDNSPQLSELIQRGVMPSGGALQLLLKGLRHLAHVQGDGSIKDSKGKTHRAPERWLESILGNNIPVSSTYAWDKVMFADRPLSHYLLHTEAEGDEPQTRHGSAGSSPEGLTTESAILRRLMRIKIIHLVDDEELLPNAVMDRYWEKLQRDCSESEDWSTELL